MRLVRRPSLKRHFVFSDRIMFLGLVFVLCLFIHSGTKGGEASEVRRPQRIAVSVLGHVPWTDTGVDVVEGQVIYFRSVGSVSLQKGNPIAYCGPEGYNLQTVQQPLRDRNLGALIGKVYLLISVEEDPETGEEIRNELSQLFYIGPENRVVMPMEGRLFLGVNENLVQDNSGRFEVDMILD